MKFFQWISDLINKTVKDPDGIDHIPDSKKNRPALRKTSATQVAHDQPPQVRRLEHNKPQSPGEHITIGLDYGTFSTKIMVRKRNSETAEILAVDMPAEGYPWFASPSIVRIVDEKIYFGSEARKMKGGKIHRSLKMLLLSKKFSVFAPDSTDVLRGPFYITCYLTWLLIQLKRGIYQKYRNPWIKLNVGAPMKAVENNAIKEHYLRIVGAAWRASFEWDSFEAEQGMSLAKWRRRIGPLLSTNIADASERRYEVFPETIAPIVSLSRDPRMGPGMYQCVDMGAGTTEISINRVYGTGADQKVVCYFDETIKLGGDNFESIDTNERTDMHNAQISRDKHRDILKNRFKKVWHFGHQKDARNHNARQIWKKLNVVLSGGATFRGDVSATIERSNPILNWEPPGSYYKCARHSPTGIECNLSDYDLTNDDRSLLAVAHGLTFERMQWPEIIPPGEVDELDDPNDGIEPPPPYWYLGD